MLDLKMFPDPETAFHAFQAFVYAAKQNLPDQQYREIWEAAHAAVPEIDSHDLANYRFAITTIEMQRAAANKL